MATPTPVFPAAVATDAQLKVANNLITATLRVAVDAVNTILFVDSTAGFAANMLVSIDKEIIAIAGVVTAPNASLIVAPGGRGFDGTVAAAHLVGAKASILIDAWHHNALAAEVKAIESSLGPNLSRVGLPGVLAVTGYQFTPQLPGGSLTVGSNVIILSPVPTGVNASDANHYLYISGGTGTAEAVLITGGTAVAGAAFGTIFVTCAFAHSGSWSIQTATGGIQETVVDAPAGSIIYMPPGQYNMYASVYSYKLAHFLGCGNQASILVGYPSNLLFFNSVAPYCRFEHFQMEHVSGFQTSGGCGILLDAIGSVENGYPHITDITFSQLYNCVVCKKAANVWISDCVFGNFVNTGIICEDDTQPDSAADTITHNSFVVSGLPSSAFAAILVNSSGAVRMIGNSILTSGTGMLNYALYVPGTVSSGIIFSSNNVENISGYSIIIQGSYSRIIISDNTISQYPGLDPNNWEGIVIKGNVAEIVIANNAIQGNGDPSNTGIFVGNGPSGNPVGVIIIGNRIKACGIGISTDDNAQVYCGPNSISAVSYPVATGLQTIVHEAAVVTYAQLTMTANGCRVWCSDSNAAGTAGGGSGQFLKRVNGSWEVD